MTILNIIIPILVLVLGVFIGKFIYETYVNKKEKKLDERLEKIDLEYISIIDKADKKANSIIEQANKEYEQKLKRIETLEDRITKKEEKVEEKISSLNEEEKKLIQKKESLDNIENKQLELLEKISGYTKDEAKDRIYSFVESTYSKDLANFIDKQKTLKKEVAMKEAASIISKVLPRVGMNQVSEFTISTIDIPNDETKGKIIGKEGRNISFFEKITGAEVIIDDTPLVVNISCFDPEKRYVAGETLKRLVKDGRINPLYIESTYNDVLSSIDDFIIEKGKEALTILNLPIMKSDIVYMIGQFYFRYSYGQNLWIHSIEVARIAEGIANELGLDGQLAKKAGLLHDIGKLKAGIGMAHAKIGGEILRQYGFYSITINSAEGHHFDVPLVDPISWIVTASDTISAARPGARFNTKNMFIERMENLENLVTEFDGVEKVYIMQAGREIMTFVDSNKVSEYEFEKLIMSIAKKIEDQLDYPGNVRVVGIRESKITTYIR
ncbi:Rnase Y domain-containing protein [Candidatus Vampirococcus lugosii]|uniref:Ribonuclease Y n=1 Tax=Candidatus Vampirococcus lugosii TaxID=2789015 RepID=A0ABS5QM25_9BACT|nr:Rnase Y domain-containing protein [Candidatus Vampirococcus lugosii]MBS8122260.1 ribonuclease [Candidatus Vampirococcus lugosii]